MAAAWRPGCLRSWVERVGWETGRKREGEREGERGGEREERDVPFIYSAEGGTGKVEV